MLGTGERNERLGTGLFFFLTAPASGDVLELDCTKLLELIFKFSGILSANC